MTKYLIGLLILLIAGVLAYRTYSKFHPEASADEIKATLADGAKRVGASADTAEEPHVALSLVNAGDAAMPLFIGAMFQYRVTDSRDAKTGDAEPKRWLLAIDRAPDGASWGLCRSGFEDGLKTYSVVDSEGDIRLDGLGFYAPPEFGDAPALTVEGETLPRNIRMIEGAVWELRIQRDVTYKIADKKGASKNVMGEATERHRATAGKVESITVPKGKFTARRIEWTSRVDIKTHGRPVLMPLTTEPYRKETMWVVPGVGIVKRSISFLTNEGNGSVTIELETGPSK